MNIDLEQIMQENAWVDIVENLPIEQISKELSTYKEQGMYVEQAVIDVHNKKATIYIPIIDFKGIRKYK